MIRRLGFFCAVLCGSGFAKDVYQPVKPGAIELGTGYAYAQITGVYDADGTYKSLKDLGLPSDYSPAVYGVPFRAKYGLGDGFDLRAEWDAAFTNKDAGDLSGMSQPVFGIKYARPWGGFFSNLTLPFATGDFDHGYLSTALEAGGLVRKRLTHFRFTGLLSYLDITKKPDILRVSAVPEVLWKKGLSTYVSADYLKSVDKDAYLLSLSPGLRADLSPALSMDAGLGVTVLGRNSPAAWSLKANLYWTLLR